MFYSAVFLALRVFKHTGVISLLIFRATHFRASEVKPLAVSSEQRLARKLHMRSDVK